AQAPRREAGAVGGRDRAGRVEVQGVGAVGAHGPVVPGGLLLHHVAAQAHDLTGAHVADLLPGPVLVPTRAVSHGVGGRLRDLVGGGLGHAAERRDARVAGVIAGVVRDDRVGDVDAVAVAVAAAEGRVIAQEVRVAGLAVGHHDGDAGLDVDHVEPLVIGPG